MWEVRCPRRRSLRDEGDQRCRSRVHHGARHLPIQLEQMLRPRRHVLDRRASGAMVAEQDTPDRRQVTAVFTWAVTPGREQDFEAWLRDTDAVAEKFPGQEGVTWLRPNGSEHRYYAVLRFRDSDSLRGWIESPQRAEQARKVQGIAVEANPRLTTTGLEAWFNLPGRTVRPPSRWRMSAITLIAVYPPVLLFEYLTHNHWHTWPLPVRTLILPVILSPLLTYAIMPFLSRVFRRFLYGTQ